MFKTIKNALKTPEVRKKLLYTLLLIVIFRVGCYITIPGVDTFTLTEQMNNATNGVTGLIIVIHIDGMDCIKHVKHIVKKM